MTDEVRDVPREGWVAAAQDAYDGGHRLFDVLTAVDLEQAGFEVVLRVWDVQRRHGLQLRSRCPRDVARFPSVTAVYAGAAWHERATAEMFGLAFEGHDTTHLLLPERFEGHPLRKDFVLAARVAKAWPGAKEPGESDADLVRPRRRPSPPGRPAGWGPE
ncbi:MAG TPA: NADH-quinone oxidoreductase subunit C [Mycobacteriales bacterium]|nr:NADH-quinone oxidoreductase subunit C [Mycobacteriales bacterium]